MAERLLAVIARAGRPRRQHARDHREHRHRRRQRRRRQRGRAAAPRRLRHVHAPRTAAARASRPTRHRRTRGTRPGERPLACGRSLERRPSSRRRIRTTASDRSAPPPPRCPAASSTRRSARRSTRCPRSCSTRWRRPRPAPPATRPRSAARRSARPPSAGSSAASAVPLTADDVIACIGTKEVVASLPRMLSLRDPSRDTVLYPAVAYPTYEMGALLAGLRAVPVPVDDEWHLDLDRVDPADADRALAALAQRPEQPHRRGRDARRGCSTRSSGRGRGGSSSPATSATPSSPTTPTARPPRRSPRSHAGADGVLVVHSLSKRSNMAGLRAGFVAGDRDARRLPRRDAQARRADDAGADPGRRGRRAGRRRARPRAAGPLRAPARAWRSPRSSRAGSCTTAARRPSTCGCATPTGARDGWAIAERPRRPPACVVAPGDFYGTASADHVRVALTLTDEQIAARVRAAPARTRLA